jgi:hypothetical protein
MPLHTVGELYASLFAVTSWPCQLSFCLCFYCPFFLALFVYVVPLSKQLGVTEFLNQNFFKCFVLPLGWVVGDEWIMSLKGYGWKCLCPNVVICWQAELEGLETTKDNTLECVQDDSRADIQVRYVPVNWLLYREVAQFPLYCSFTWQHCALVNYMLLCVDLTWSQHGTGITLQNMCHNINIIVTQVTVTVARCTRTVYSVEQ